MVIVMMTIGDGDLGELPLALLMTPTIWWVSVVYAKITKHCRPPSMPTHAIKRSQKLSGFIWKWFPIQYLYCQCFPREGVFLIFALGSVSRNTVPWAVFPNTLPRKTWSEWSNLAVVGWFERVCPPLVDHLSLAQPVSSGACNPDAEADPREEAAL